MEFEARRLRVQLPCGTDTLIECVFATCRLPSVITCLYRTPFCPTFISRCGGYRSIICDFGTNRTFTPTCGGTIWYTETLTETGTETIREVTQFEVDELPLLREQLEGQLKEVIAAQEQVAKRNKTSR
ncbi:MAG TPA: hypothetical protein VF763_03440 [Candidatus Limnocylindrales bacterium]